MKSISRNGQCDCPIGKCGYDIPYEECINRLEGDVVTDYCEKCGSHAWHHNGECLRGRKGLHNE